MHRYARESNRRQKIVFWLKRCNMGQQGCSSKPIAQVGGLADVFLCWWAQAQGRVSGSTNPFFCHRACLQLAPPPCQPTIFTPICICMHRYIGMPKPGSNQECSSKHLEVHIVFAAHSLTWMSMRTKLPSLPAAQRQHEHFISYPWHFALDYRTMNRHDVPESMHAPQPPCHGPPSQRQVHPLLLMT